MARGTLTWRTRYYGSPCMRSKHRTVSIGGVSMPVDYRTVAAFKRLDAIVRKWGYKVYASQTGSYNCRKIAGSSSMSPHAWATAVDINWSLNPALKTTLKTNMPRGMVNEILGVKTNGGVTVFRWGGNFTSFKDPMHFEIIATPAELSRGIRGSTPVSTSSTSTSGRPVLRRGSTGTHVTYLQQRLRTHGHSIGVDGKFGLRTHQAVVAFQRKHKLKVDGIVGRATWSKLTAAPPKPRVQDTRPTLRRGSKGEAVKYVQRKLGLKQDGIFGPVTERAVNNLKRSMGLKVDGVVGSAVWKRLVGLTVRPRLRRGARNRHVTYLQRKLGLKQDGIFGPITEGAVKRFQAKHKIASTGVVNGVTWAILN